MRMTLPVKLAALALTIGAALTLGLVVAVHSLNLDRIKQLLAAQVKTATGRTLTINGPLDLQLGLIPRLVANGLSLSNPPGSSRADMVTIKRFEMELSLLPLLKRELRINRLKLASPDILIETSAKGPGNLDFRPPSGQSDPKPDPSAGQDGTAYQLTLLEVTIDNGILAHLDRSTGTTEKIALQDLSILPDKKAPDLLAIRLAAKARGRAITVKGTVGSVAAAIAGTPWPIQLQGETNGLALTVAGLIADLPAFRGLNLEMTALGEELAELLQLAGQENPAPLQALGPFKFAGRLDDSTGHLALVEVEATAGKAKTLLITAAGSIADLPALRGLNLQVTALGEELAELLPLAGRKEPNPPQALGPFKLAGRLSDSAGRLTLTGVEATAGKAETLLLTAKGTLKDLTGALTTDLALTLASSNPDRLSALVGTDLPALGPVSLSTQLRGSGTAWKLSDLKAGVAGSDLTGEVTVEGSKRLRLAGRLAATTLDLTKVQALTAPPGQQPTAKADRSTGSDGRLFSAQPLSLQTLRALDLDLDLAVQADQLLTRDLQLTKLAATIALRDGRLTIKPFRTGLAGGSVEGEISLDGAGKVPIAVIDLNARQVELGKLGHSPLSTGGKSDLRLNLRAQGDSIRALMATLNGEAILSVGPGRMTNKSADWVAGDLLFQVLGALNPLAKSEPFTSLSCAAARFSFQDGMATTDKGLAARTDKIDLIGSGTIDLRSEQLDLNLRPIPRHGLGLSLSSPIAGLTRVRGTLANPALGIDAGGTLRTAASMGAAAATGGLSMLGEKLFDKISADDDPCRTALGQAPAKADKGQIAPQAEPQKKSHGGLLHDLFGR